MDAAIHELLNSFKEKLTLSVNRGTLKTLLGPKG